MTESIKPPSQSFLRRIARVVQWFESRGIDKRPDRAPVAVPDDGSKPFYNNVGSTLSKGHIVWLSSFSSTYIAWLVTQPTIPLGRRLAVVAEDTPNNDYGRLWIDGVHPVLCASYSGLSAGDRVDAQASSYVAAENQLGAIIVEGTCIDQPSSPPAGQGWIMGRIGQCYGLPKVYEATANASGGSITGKWVESDGDVVGDNYTFKVLP